MIYTIEQLADIIDGDRGNNYPKQDEFVDQGFCVFLNTGNVTTEGFRFEEVQYITQEKDAILRKGKLQRGDIVYTTRGTVGNAAYYNASVPYEHIRINSGMVILRCKDAVDPYFLYQILKSDYYRPYFKQYCTGSAQPQLPIRNFSKIQLDIPGYAIQEHIASVLSAYDDLIENNQKQIKLLEEAAQRLYKEWFVDLHFPGYEDVPVVDGVPEGWNVFRIKDTCSIVGGGTPSTKVSEYYINGNIPWATPTDITNSFSIVLLDTAVKITKSGFKNCSSKMLPPEAILMTSRASVGFFGIYDHEICTNQGFISCVPFKPEMQMYLLFNLMNRVSEIRNIAGGSTYLEISKRTFGNLQIVVPNNSILAKFQTIAHKHLDRMRTMTKIVAELTDARDRLLPKLMNGELEV